MTYSYLDFIKKDFTESAIVTCIFDGQRIYVDVNPKDGYEDGDYGEYENVTTIEYGDTLDDWNENNLKELWEEEKKTAREIAEYFEIPVRIEGDDMMIGYAETDFDGTGMMEIQRIDAVGIFDSDEEAVEQAIKDGIKIIPVEELPENFDRRYLGWIDTPENRKKIEEYCKEA